MSFQDLTGGGPSVRHFRSLHRDVRKSIVVESPNPRHCRRNNSVLCSPKPSRPMPALHGLVLHQDDPDDEPDEIVESLSGNRGHRSSIPTVMERKSMFSRLSHETQLFGRMVADLEGLLALCGESPEATWRARILMQSAQETDRELWTKLYNYENTFDGDMDPESRQAHTACMKLHRDFKRTRKSLVLALSFFEKRQRAEVSRLGAVGWSTGEMMVDSPKMKGNGAQQRQPQHQEEDFFDRAIRERDAFDHAMRQREVTEINKKMHEVNQIYTELAQVVDDQQEKIDQLEDGVESAKFDVNAARNSSFSFLDMCTGNEVPSTPKCTPERVGHDIDWEGLFACGSMAQASGSLRESYGIAPDEASDYSSVSDDSPVEADPEPERRKFRRSSSYSEWIDKKVPMEYSRSDRNLKKHLREDSWSERNLKKVPTEDKTRRSQKNQLREDSWSERSLKKLPAEDKIRRSQKKLARDYSDRSQQQRDSSFRSERSQRRRRNSTKEDNLRVSEQFHWMMPFETLSEDVKAVQGDLIGWGKGMMTPKKERREY